MAVPRGDRRGSDSQGLRPEDARLPAVQNGAAPEAGGSMRQSASGASTFLVPEHFNGNYFMADFFDAFFNLLCNLVSVSRGRIIEVKNFHKVFSPHNDQLTSVSRNPTSTHVTFPIGS